MAAGTLNSRPKFDLPFSLLPCLFFFLGFTQAQQGYVNNQQLACEDPSKDNNITRGFSCNGDQISCLSYITFRSEPPFYTTPVSIAYLLGAEATQISSQNNLSADVSSVTPKSMVVVPVNCSCFSTKNASFYQHNASYTIKFTTETYFSISNDTYQGLTTCQAMKAQNPIDYRDLKVGEKLVVPVRCACPTQNQTRAGAKYLLSYIVTWGDSISSIAETFGVEVKSILEANELSETDIIFPFTPILVPLEKEPARIELPQSSPPPPGLAPQIPTSPVGESASKSSKKWVFIGVGIGVGLLLLLGLAGFLFCFFKHQRKAHKASPIVSSPPSDLKQLPDSTNYTPNSCESNRIKGSVFRGSFQGDDAAVKVMKGDVSSEINLLKKINHSNIIRLSGFCLHEGNTYLVYEYADKAKVANFGLARTVEDNDDGGLQLTRHVVGTKGYMAPEYIENGVVTPKLDVFAFGVIISELLSGKNADIADKIGGGKELLSASIKEVLEGDNVREKLKNFIDPSLRPEYPLDLAFSMAELAKMCVAHDLNARPSISEVLVTSSKILSSSLDWDPSYEFDRSTSLTSAR
ncbi:hypothetical protein F3Y22_tig00110584pilonHSYRG00417 [Hibiscus syriacus]|uniref:LysM domain receptor-like kinase 4 n=1 Tax=Hibiscus syriacus TaxID=106335 RepID=A0A6A3A5J7_HIBSY|nr:hypothetical protein F3Y22_tig00110584pilonHSYRG00417 [Hibiscus syriacus]